jgi:hypothetical protein
MSEMKRTMTTTTIAEDCDDRSNNKQVNEVLPNVTVFAGPNSVHIVQPHEQGPNDWNKWGTGIYMGAPPSQTQPQPRLLQLQLDSPTAASTSTDNVEGNTREAQVPVAQASQELQLQARHTIIEMPIEEAVATIVNHATTNRETPSQEQVKHQHHTSITKTTTTSNKPTLPTSKPKQPKSKYKKSYTSTVCMVPPESAIDAWTELTRLRTSVEDPGLYRWPPHVNLLYPFAPLRKWKDLADVDAEELSFEALRVQHYDENKRKRDPAAAAMLSLPLFQDDILLLQQEKDEHQKQQDRDNNNDCNSSNALERALDGADDDGIVSLLDEIETHNTDDEAGDGMDAPTTVTVLSRLCHAASKIEPFYVSLDKFGCFGGKQRGVLWIYPTSYHKKDNITGNAEDKGNVSVSTDDVQEPLVDLQQCLQDAVPWCSDQQQKGSGGFSPHMTLSHFESLDAAKAAQRELESFYKPQTFLIKEVYVLHRSGDDGQFEIAATIPLGSHKAISIADADDTSGRLPPLQITPMPTVYIPPRPFVHMPPEEDDWIHEQRMALKQRRNGRGRRRKSGGGNRRRSENESGGSRNGEEGCVQREGGTAKSKDNDADAT